MNAPPSTPSHMFGTITRMITVTQLAPSERAASARVRASIDDRDESIAR